MELEKREAIYANKKMDVCIYNLNIKVQEAISKDICYSKVSNVDCASLKLFACLVDNGVIEEVECNHPSDLKVQRHRFRTRIFYTDDDNMDNDDDDAVDIDINKAGNWRRKKKLRFRHRNKKIIIYINELRSKMEEALIKDMRFSLVNGIDEVSSNLVDCLLDDQILDKHYRLATNAGMKKTKNGSPVTRVLVELRKTAIWRSNDPRRLDFTDKEDGYRIKESTEEKMTLQKEKDKLQLNLAEKANLLKKSESSMFRCTTKLEAAEKNIKELKNIIADLKEKNRLKSDEVIMLYNSIETERSEHELEMMRYREDILTENQPTTTCTCNRMSRTTNVFNVKIVSSQVSFNENSEQEMKSLIAGNGQNPAIEEDN